MVWFHAATGFGDFSISIAARRHPETHRDGEEEETTDTNRRHLQDERVRLSSVVSVLSPDCVNNNLLTVNISKLLHL